MQWTKVGINCIGVLYHPPKPQYKPESLLDYIESNVEEINQTFHDCTITLAGDFNQLSDREITERTGLTCIVYQLTRGTNTLDRMYVSHPRYNVVRVVSSVVKSDHQAVVAYSDVNQCAVPKQNFQRTYRPTSPDQHAHFLRYISAIDININIVQANSTESEFDNFYNILAGLLNTFYPLRTITTTPRNPAFITPV